MNSECNGVLVVDKPAGISSAKAVAIVKRGLRASKVGHTGTLDPFATGVLICCINQATRLAQFFLHGAKTYDATLCLGIDTDTQDATGAVVAEKQVNVTEAEVRAAVTTFTGTLHQKPPVFSALKHQGKPLYQLARSGNPVQKPPRQVRIEYIDILEIRPPFIRFEVRCSAGTYVRTLCSDIGQHLGCGGHLKSLRRTESGGFGIADALSLDEFLRCDDIPALWDRLIPMTEAIRQLPAATVDRSLKSKLQNGGTVKYSDFHFAAEPLTQGFFSIIDETGRLIAIMEKPGPDETCKYSCVFRDSN
jgi:tRNA pseudouridine55 synthase